MIRTAMAQNSDLRTSSIGEDRCTIPYLIKSFLSDIIFGRRTRMKFCLSPFSPRSNSVKLERGRSSGWIQWQVTSARCAMDRANFRVSRVVTRSGIEIMVLRLPLLLLLVLLTGSCATPETDDPEALIAAEALNDPFESVNRGIFVFNRQVDSFVLNPLAYGYRMAVPSVVRERIHSALVNLRSPAIFANDLLQGEAERAGVTLGRFVVNSTLGFGGLFDMASEMGLDHHEEDFGQTLAVWGIEEGPYLVLPILGPSNPRDAIGIVVDLFLDPLNYLLDTDKEFLYARAGVTAVDERERNFEVIESLKATSLDLYATYRSFYRQHREYEIRNGELPPPLPLPDFAIAGNPGPTRRDLGKTAVFLVTTRSFNRR